MISGVRLLMACSLVWLFGCQATPSPLDALLKGNADARGGAAAIESIESIRIALEITEPAFTLRGDYRATRDGFMRIDVYAGEERVFTEALGPQGGWQWPQGAAATLPLSGEGRQALERGRDSNLYGLHELPKLGYRLELLGRVALHGEERWLLSVQAPDGFQRYIYLDPESSLQVASSEVSALHPDVDPGRERSETSYSDFQVTAGVLFPRMIHKRRMADGLELQRTRITRIEINPVLRPEAFSEPNDPGVPSHFDQ